MNPDNSKRDRLEIWVDMLNAMSVPMLQTRIMYSANLNHSQLTKHLDALEKMGLCEATGVDSVRYIITEKGREFLKTVGGCLS